MVARVLVVEDDSTVSSVLSAYLSKAGFDQRIAADAPTALRELPRTVTVGDLLVHLRARTAKLRGEALGLTHREFDLLAYLTHRDEAFTKEALMRRVWGWDFGDTSTVTVHVRRLREKIELDPSDPQLVLTVRGTGYRFDGQESS